MLGLHMAAVLGLISAVLFALAATLQQLGQFVLARRGKKVEGFAELFRLILVPVWLLGTVILLVGYLTQGAALDRGKLVVVQPLLVTTIVWALPLGYLLTSQRVTRRQVLGLLFGLSATFDKPVINELHVSIGHVVTSWATLGLVGFGFVAFLIQQLSLATGQLAPAMAAVSVSNPAVSVVLGILLYQEKLTRPIWHVFVAVAALLAALAGAAIITLANRETQIPDAVAADDRARPDPALA
jgi:drug/metabolite transporter (DMT)-like permease